MSSSNSSATSAVSAGRAGNGDLVPADVYIGVERPLDHVQEFIPGAEQADHRVVIRDHDLDLRSRLARAAVLLAVGARVVGTRVVPGSARLAVAAGAALAAQVIV